MTFGVIFDFTMGVLEHADWFTDGAMPIQAACFQCVFQQGFRRSPARGMLLGSAVRGTGFRNPA